MCPRVAPRLAVWCREAYGPAQLDVSVTFLNFLFYFLMHLFSSEFSLSVV